jgi:hypothetical protein
MIGFSINERLANGFAMGHHCKAIDEFPGTYPLLIRQTAVTLLAHGFERLNIMQDLGQPGLESSKHRYRPVGFLRKYCLSPQPASQPRVEESRVAFPAIHHDARWMGTLDVG